MINSVAKSDRITFNAADEGWDGRSLIAGPIIIKASINHIIIKCIEKTNNNF